jgi:protein SCO1/2
MTSRTAQRALWAGFLLALALVIAAGIVSLRAGTPAAPAGLPVLGVVPEFALVERSGRTVTRTELLGGPWVANFIFTRCSGVCPALSTQMARLQRTFGERGRAVRLVSFSVDPSHDTPPVLQDYAQRFGADPRAWLFLTGARDTLHTLIGQGFRLSVAERSPEDAGADGELITHSDRLVLVDATGQIRGYYHGTEAEAVERLLSDVSAL